MRADAYNYAPRLGKREFPSITLSAVPCCIFSAIPDVFCSPAWGCNRACCTTMTSRGDLRLMLTDLYPSKDPVPTSPNTDDIRRSPPYRSSCIPGHGRSPLCVRSGRDATRLSGIPTMYIAGSGTDAPPRRSFTKAFVDRRTWNTRRPAAFLANDPSYAEGRLRPCRLGDAAFVKNGAFDLL